MEVAAQSGLVHGVLALEVVLVVADKDADGGDGEDGCKDRPVSTKFKETTTSNKLATTPRPMTAAFFWQKIVRSDTKAKKPARTRQAMTPSRSAVRTLL